MSVARTRAAGEVSRDTETNEEPPHVATGQRKAASRRYDRQGSGAGAPGFSRLVAKVARWGDTRDSHPPPCPVGASHAMPSPWYGQGR